MLKQLQTSTLVWWFSHHPATLARVWVGRVHKSIVMSQFGGSPFGMGGLLQLLSLDLWSRRPTLSCLQTKWEAWSNYAKGWSEFWSWLQLWLKSLWEWPPIVGVLGGVLQRQTSRELIWGSFTQSYLIVLPWMKLHWLIRIPIFMHSRSAPISGLL